MEVSWNWLSEFVDLSSLDGPKGLGELLTNRGLEVEAIHQQAQGLEKVVSVQILKKEPHPQADRLSLCQVTLGSGAPLEIVCGAQNMKVGDKVALAQVGAQLPNGLTISQSKIRGVVSNGMLCSEEELKFKEKSEGILILPADTPLGKPLAQILGRDDSILTLKLTANRADCLSHFGIAREIAAALGKKVKSISAKPLSLTKTPIVISLDAGEKAPQFFGTMIEGVKIGPSPTWVVKRLESLGSRSINNVVDASNLVMLELGHPMHSYDADQIQGNQIRVRMSQKDEMLPLLDGTEVKLTGQELVIADGKRAIGLAGVMGGGNSEVTSKTTRLFLECAEFDPSLVRKSSTRFQHKTDASHRFERGIDPGGLPLAIARLVELTIELAGGKLTSASAVQLPSRTPKDGVFRKPVAVSPAYFEKFLGMTVAPEKAKEILIAHGCKVEKLGNDWTVTPPSYRGDLSIKEDLAEEIARSLGYDAINETLPQLKTHPKTIFEDPSFARNRLIDQAKNVLVDQGISETLTYGFTNKSWLAKFGMESQLKLINPLSEEWEYLTPSLLPGLVRNALNNWNHHFGSESPAIRLFELRPTFHSTGAVAAKGEMETGVEEKWKLAISLSGPRYAGGLRNEIAQVDFYDLKAVIENLLRLLDTKGIRFIPLSQSRTGNSLYHPEQSVEVLAGNEVAGHFGLFHPKLARELKTRFPLWVAELNWEVLDKLSRPVFQYREFKPWGEFPPIERDFALLVKDDISADKITQVALKAGRPLAKSAKIFDVYKGSQVAQGMTSVAVRVIFYEESRSLQETEAEASSAKILESWKKELGAELRS